MKLEKWVLLAEVLSAVAVVATLLVLVFEVREGNDLVRVSTFQDIVWQFTDLRRDLLDDPELLELTRQRYRGEYPEQDASDGFKLSVALTNEFNVFDVAYLSYQSGIVGEKEWQRLARSLCQEVDGVPEDYLADQYRQLTEEFAAYKEMNC